MVDIDPKTGAPIVSPTTSGSLHTGDGPILTIPPVVSTSTIPPADDTKSDALVKLTDAEPLVFESRREELLYKMNQMVEEAGGISNIGMTSDYWGLLKEYRTL